MNSRRSVCRSRVVAFAAVIVTVLCVVQITQPRAWDCPPEAAVEHAYARVYSARIVDAIEVPLEELVEIARTVGTEEIAMFDVNIGPEKKTRLWTIRPGAEGFAYQGYTLRARTHLAEQMALGAMMVSADGMEMTEEKPCLDGPVRWTLPKTAESPLRCRITAGDELIGTITVHEVPSPGGGQPWPTIVRMDDHRERQTVVQFYEYLDDRPEGLPVPRPPEIDLSNNIHTPEVFMPGLRRSPAAGETGMDFVSFGGYWGWPGFEIGWCWDDLSWIAMDFDFAAGAVVNAGVSGDFRLDWTSESEGDLTIGNGQGYLGFDFVLALAGTLHVDVPCPGWDSYHFPVPYLPQFDFGTAASTLFDTYLLESAAFASGYVANETVYEKGFDIPGTGLGVSLKVDADLVLTVTMQGDSVHTPDGTVFKTEFQTETVSLVDNVYANAIDYDENLDVTLTVTFKPDFCVSVDPLICSPIEWCISDESSIPQPTFPWPIDFEILDPNIPFPSSTLRFDESTIIPEVATRIERSNQISLDGRDPQPNPPGAICSVAEYTFDTYGSYGDSTRQGWTSVDYSGLGDYAGLFSGYDLTQEDRIVHNRSWMWAFIKNSTYNYSCGGHAEQTAVPTGSQAYLQNEIISPAIHWDRTWPCNNAVLQFDIYRDLPFSFGVFYTWRVRTWHDDQVGPWRSRDLYYYGRGKTCNTSAPLITGGGKDWFTAVHEFGDLVEPGADSIQVALGVWDLSAFWQDRYSFDACHSHAPLIDNVEVYRYQAAGPTWGVREIDLFQDTFPGDGSTSGTARADMALDTNHSREGLIIPGDSACVSVGDAVRGMREGINPCGPSVYCYVSVPGNPYEGGAIESSDGGPCIGASGMFVRYPVVDSVNVAGRMWYVIQMDTSFAADNRLNPIPGRYCVDLNDNLFTPPDTIFFFFGAQNSAGNWTYWSEFTGETADINEAFAEPMEFQVLPTGNSTILYVDKCDGWGAQRFFDVAFEMIGVAPDRYDVRGPSSNAGNSLGGRLQHAVYQLVNPYRTIIWNSGDLSVGTMGDGTGGNPGKEYDTYLLYYFLNDHQHAEGHNIYFSGDDLAEEWWGLTGVAETLRSTYIDFTLVSGDHRDNPMGAFVSPLVVAQYPSLVGFDHGGTPDTLVGYAGYPFFDDFDVISPVTPSNLEMVYAGTTDKPAVIARQFVNFHTCPTRVVLSGFSFHHIRDDRPAGIPDYVHHLYDILHWFDNSIGAPVGGGEEPRYKNSLAQNYPNPFNPTTTIEYSISKPAVVTLKIYNVKGQLVKTLIDNEEQHPDRVRPVTWGGRNDRGLEVASGIYFFRLVAGDFTDTKKMVLLK